MEASQEHARGKSIPSLFDWMEEFAEEVVQGMASPPPADSPIANKIGAIIEMACGEDRSVTFDSLFCYVAAARGLHQAAARVHEKGDDPKWAQELHEWGQLFLTYAVGDIEAMTITALEQEAANEPKGSVH